MTLIALENASMHAIKKLLYNLVFIHLILCELDHILGFIAFQDLVMGPILYSTLRVLDLQFLYILIKFVALSELRLSWYP